MKYSIVARISPKEISFHKMGGLVPVIVQEHASGAILMSAFVNHEALMLTLKTGHAHYYSRSRNTVWEKGATSGNRQKIIEILTDCDNDSLLYTVIQMGSGACHTGSYSCFHRLLHTDE